ncbi:MAG: hypothetical protein NAG76_19870 [Candidatus Pristimantibacillus lignocellulolyticus]|uniref:YhfM-like domain-containing protein n=1 Tax=Candidatus Pristimantibacillus lignocellulolyticus TaxID=2994561 RepID=A0A9J6ZDE3_9BACL|nr:MAG: hypothetical protein NAG76_19870 [Candidatus Pristimantibacillus lignocellulolyticus]
MKKISILVLYIALMSAILVGCQSEGNATMDADKTRSKQQVTNTNNSDIKLNQEVSETNNLESEIEYISITNLFSNSETVYHDDNSNETLKSIIASAEREPGIVNMTNPEYKMMVVYKNEDKQNFNIWIAETDGKSALMNSSDTNTIYSISKEMNNKLLELLKKQ